MEMARNKQRQMPVSRESSFNATDVRCVAGLISTCNGAVAMAKPLRWFTLDDEIVDEYGTAPSGWLSTV